MSAHVPVPPNSFLRPLERLSRRGAARSRSDDGERLYEWDGLHGEVEVYDKRGYHLGVADAASGQIIKDAKRGRRIDV
ncbi:MAG TPA: colicin E3/pyocin S6 family cytotoxin [Solirubrobacteraceae bacterium]|nr:colicin E3/pyocin S6 family cytotoxin [Solirubrobacteraceae bacterium]